MSRLICKTLYCFTFKVRMCPNLALIAKRLRFLNDLFDSLRLHVKFSPISVLNSSYRRHIAHSPPTCLTQQDCCPTVGQSILAVLSHKYQDSITCRSQRVSTHVTMSQFHHSRQVPGRHGTLGGRTHLSHFLAQLRFPNGRQRGRFRLHRLVSMPFTVSLEHCCHCTIHGNNSGVGNSIFDFRRNVLKLVFSRFSFVLTSLFLTLIF